MKADIHELSELEDRGYGWISFGRKLAAAVTRIAGGELDRQLTQASSKALNAGKTA